MKEFFLFESDNDRSNRVLERVARHEGIKVVITSVDGYADLLFRTLPELNWRSLQKHRFGSGSLFNPAKWSLMRAYEEEDRPRLLELVRQVVSGELEAEPRPHGTIEAIDELDEELHQLGLNISELLSEQEYQEEVEETPQEYIDEFFVWSQVPVLHVQGLKLTLLR